ncbi:MAG: CehA/McbA family metallohydrolase [Acidobacteriota bacterium]|nr:CehA/McbA family metallohydrolase [Acidobacteriota bacterium]
MKHQSSTVLMKLSRFHRNKAIIFVVFFFTAWPIFAQREAVLEQIDLPHRYYYREMYLPQLTSGPNAAAWMPDSRAVVYSMAGTLWRQQVDSPNAKQLTASAGYDYEPDCSPDGHWVAFVRYEHDAMELWALNLTTLRSHQLTSGGNVNVDPRFSPDGKRIVFVSTSYHKRFHIFVADFSNGTLTNVQRLTGEDRSTLPRFYYSEFNHEISPTWSPDGKEILFVSNRRHIYGTGGFWRMRAESGAEAHEIHYEETAWKARPEFSPDGKRLVYASYLGGQWHQLWIMPAEGGDAFPISYGDFDNTNPRWSPDGTRIAFISNRSGNTALWLQDVIGGAQREVVARHKHYLHPMGHLSITVLDASGKPTPARISVTGADARAYAPDDAWMQAEDAYDHTQSPFEAHYFHSNGTASLTVPAGRVRLEVAKGIEYSVEHRTVLCEPDAHVVIHLQPIAIPDTAGKRWVSADLHVHMNYGGAYRNTPAGLVAQQEAEDLFLVNNLIVNKEQRIPDIAYFRTTPDPASTPRHWLLQGQEFHTSFWGHLSLLHLTHNYLLPDYASYGNTAAASLVPTNADIEDLAHKQDALVGYAHPFDIQVDPYTDPTLDQGQPLDEALELPVDVALGKVDYIETLGFSDHRMTASVWYRLLNCGFHLPAGAGSDTMANYASLRGPVGLVRVFADLPKSHPTPDLFLNELKHGRTFATNGPLLGLTLGGKSAGDQLRLAAGTHSIPFTAWLRSFVPVDHFQLVCRGKVVRDFPLDGSRQSANVKGTIPVDQTGWCVLRASSDKPENPVYDDYIYATTSPIYIDVAGSKPHPKEDAAFFIKWIDRLTALADANTNWNTPAEKSSTLQMLRTARQIYVNLQNQ